MTGTLVDSNVLIDVISESPAWFSWSSAQLAAAFDRGKVIINPVIYAEVSIGFRRIEEVEDALADFSWLHLSREACYLAGKSFLEYKRRGGIRSAPLPDFFIGAQASIHGLTLLTRDTGRYHSYFRGLKLIEPS